MSFFNSLHNVYGLEIEKILTNIHSNQDSDIKEFKESFENLSETISEAKKEINDFSLSPDERFFDSTIKK